jgi:hypothetical protein
MVNGVGGLMSCLDVPSTPFIFQPLRWKVTNLGHGAPLFTHSGIKFPWAKFLLEVWCSRFEVGSMGSITYFLSG